MVKEINFKVDYKKYQITEEFNTDDPLYPIVLSSPHSGQIFPDEFLANTVLSIDELRSSEDCFVTEIVKPASDCGIPLLSMNISRTFIDINRDKIEMDDTMYYDPPQLSASTQGSRRCRVGLGVIPRIVSQNRNIYDGLLSYEEAMARIKNVYDPYHKRLKQLVDKCQKKFGLCLLVDCHSMPSQICRIMTEDKPVEFCLSTLFDQSCPEEMYGFIGQKLQDCGYRVEYNRPYSGGFITFNYCQPRRDLYTLQIEVNRAIYMDENVYKKTPDFQSVSKNLSESLVALGKILLDFKK